MSLLVQLYLAQYEHLPLQLSRSSCQPLGLQQLLSMADADMAAQWQQLELGYPPNIGSLQLRKVCVSSCCCVWVPGMYM